MKASEHNPHTLAQHFLANKNIICVGVQGLMVVLANKLKTCWGAGMDGSIKVATKNSDTLSAQSLHLALSSKVPFARLP